ncbi:hypothetical protein ACJX0J_037563, partial [Zea mays]
LVFGFNQPWEVGAHMIFVSLSALLSEGIYGIHQFTSKINVFTSRIVGMTIHVNVEIDRFIIVFKIKIVGMTKYMLIQQLKCMIIYVFEHATIE